MNVRWWAALGVALCLVNPSPAAADQDPVRVLVIAAHPDDETLFNLGRFAERGWHTSVALVTNGEGGQVMQSIRGDYDPQRDDDVLIESPPGPRTWVVTPPHGPHLRVITSPTALARERRAEFVASLATHRVRNVYLLSSLRDPDYEDNWDRGISAWQKPRLRRELRLVAAAVRPDLIITLNPGETWAHPAHVGLGRWVRNWHKAGVFDTGHRPDLYGLREHAWYEQSTTPQAGDSTFARTAHSTVLRSSYADYWRTATAAYMSQSSHPVWLQARVEAGILPGYHGVDIIRRLAGRPMSWWLRQSTPDRQAYRNLPRRPRIVHVR